MRQMVRMSMPVLMLCAAAATAATAQTASPHHVDVQAAAPRPEDVGSIDGMVNAWYEVISAPAGAPRQWARDRSLYIADVRFVSTATDGKTVRYRIHSHQAYVDASDADMVKKGFFEKEIHRVTEQYGPMAHVWSTYESRETKDGPVTARGINSIELFWDGKRWWIANAVWADESKERPIPAQYLP